MVNSRSGRLHEKVAIVTGGSSGIGRAIALAFANEGANLVIADLEPRSKAGSEAKATTEELIVGECKRQALFCQTDVCSSESVDALIARAVQEYGRVDMYGTKRFAFLKANTACSIVNAAGIAPEIHNPQPIWSIPDRSWASTMGVNATGSMNTCRAATAQMMKQPELPGGDRGWVVNISSIYGQTAVAGNGQFEHYVSQRLGMDHCHMLCPANLSLPEQCLIAPRSTLLLG